MFKTIVLVCVFLLLNVGCSSCHDSRRINSLEKILKRKLKRLKEDFQDELYVKEEKIKADVTNDLPDMIQAALFELYKTGQMESISNQHAQEEIRMLKQHVNQLKTGMIQLREQLKLTEKTHAEELKTISKELKKVQENYVLDKMSSEKKCRCVENKNQRNTSGVSNSKEVTTIAPVIKPTEDTRRFNHLLAVRYDGQFYQIDLQNMTKTKLSLRGNEVRDVTFDSVSRSIIWTQEQTFKKSVVGVFAMNIDSKKITTLVSNTSCRDIAVDDRLLFYIARTRSSGEYILRTTIDDSTDVATLKLFNIIFYGPSHLTLDPSEQHVFYSYEARILQMNYDGQDEKVIARNIRISALTFDPLQGVLYCAKGNRIIKVAPWRSGQTGVEEPKVVLVVKGVGSILDIELDGDVLYTGDMGGNFWESNLKTNSTSLLSNINSFNQYHFYLIRNIQMCLVP